MNTLSAKASMLGLLGRLPPRVFVLGITAIYVVSFFAQPLLADRVTFSFGFWPFIAAQAVLIGAWFALHAGRLRDAGQPAGLAVGIALLYALAIVLAVLLVAALTPAYTLQSAQAPQPSRLAVLVPIAAMIADPDRNALGLVAFGFLFIALVPIFVAISFSIWTATRKSIA